MGRDGWKTTFQTMCKGMEFILTNIRTEISTKTSKKDDRDDLFKSALQSPRPASPFFPYHYHCIGGFQTTIASSIMFFLTTLQFHKAPTRRDETQRWRWSSTDPCAPCKRTVMKCHIVAKIFNCVFTGCCHETVSLVTRKLLLDYGMDVYFSDRSSTCLKIVDWTIEMCSFFAAYFVTAPVLEMKRTCAQIDDKAIDVGASSRNDVTDNASNYVLNHYAAADYVTLDTRKASAHTNTLSGFQLINATSSSTCPDPLLRLRYHVPSKLLLRLHRITPTLLWGNNVQRRRTIWTVPPVKQVVLLMPRFQMAKLCAIPQH